MKPLLERIGVCSWSLQPEDPDALACHLRTIGLRKVQLDLDAVRREPKVWEDLTVLQEDGQIEILSGMFRCVGEDYSTLQSIRETGGVLPDETWQDTWEVAQESAVIAKDFGIKVVSFHAGFIPHDESDPVFEKLLHRIRLVTDVFASRGIDLALETGQESALTLNDFLHKVGRVSIGVNFDPANMLIYDMGNPIDALEVLGPRLKQCHIKDGFRPQNPGTFGCETVVGLGEVPWREFFTELNKVGFAGQMFIEREEGTTRVSDMQHAREFIEHLDL